MTVAAGESMRGSRKDLHSYCPRHARAGQVPFDGRVSIGLSEMWPSVMPWFRRTRRRPRNRRDVVRHLRSNHDVSERRAVDGHDPVQR